MRKLCSSSVVRGRSEGGRALRSRWAAVGAAVAVTLGAGAGIGLVSATGSAPSSMVSITPERILDTRVDLGLAGQFTSPQGQNLQVTGSVATPSGSQVVVPAGATAVSLNVTAVQPSAAGFVSVRPAGTPGAPETSNLNFDAGDITPNAVIVALPDSGAIEITYDAFGQAGPTTDVLVDVMGYFVEGEGAPGPEGPAGPAGATGPTGATGPAGEPAPTALLPIAMGNITGGGAINNSFNVESVVFAGGVYQITFEDRDYSFSQMVTVVTPAALCDHPYQVMASGATHLAVHFTGSETCAFSFVTYAP